MHVRVGFGVAVLVAMAGCASTPAPSSQTQHLDALPAGLFLVDDGQIFPLETVRGLEVSPDRSAYGWSPLEFLERDRMNLLLLRATQATNYTVFIDQSIRFTGGRDGLTSSHETVCVASISGPASGSESQPVPGEFVLDMALGREPVPPALLPDYDLGWGALYGVEAPQPPGSTGGGAAGSGQVTGHLEAGQWILWGGGLSGTDPSETDVDSRMGFNLTVEHPLQVYDLPPAPLVCGMGFSALQNSTFHAGPPGLHIGGSLDVPMDYGSAFVWLDICWPAEGPAPFNRAHVRVGEEEALLTQATLNLTLGSFATTPARMSVEQWKGYPLWILLGLAMDPHDFTPAQLLGCLR